MRLQRAWLYKETPVNSLPQQGCCALSIPPCYPAVEQYRLLTEAYLAIVVGLRLAKNTRQE